MPSEDDSKNLSVAQPTDMDEKTQRRRQRGLDRERIAELMRLTDMTKLNDTQKEQKKKITDVLQTILNTPAPLTKDDPNIQALQDAGFLYTAEELNGFIANAQTAGVEQNPKALAEYMLEEKLKQYVDSSKLIEHGEDKHEGYAVGYASIIGYKKKIAVLDAMLAELDSDEDKQKYQATLHTLSQQIDHFIAEQNKRADHRELSAAATFFSDPARADQLATYDNDGQQHHVPPETFSRAQTLYQHWNGIDPLPDVNVIKRERRSTIRVDNLGVTLPQLSKIMRECAEKGTNTIDLPENLCNGKTIDLPTHEHNGKTYYALGDYEEGEFRVHAYYKDESGALIKDDYPGWLKDLTDPMAAYLKQLAAFQLEPKLEVETGPTTEPEPAEPEPEPAEPEPEPEPEREMASAGQDFADTNATNAFFDDAQADEKRDPEVLPQGAEPNPQDSLLDAAKGVKADVTAVEVEEGEAEVRTFKLDPGPIEMEAEVKEKKVEPKVATVVEDIQPDDLSDTDLETLKEMLRQPEDDIKKTFGVHKRGEPVEGANKSYMTALNFNSYILNGFSRAHSTHLAAASGEKVRKVSHFEGDRGEISIQKLEEKGYNNGFYLSDAELRARARETFLTQKGKKGHDEKLVDVIREVCEDYRARHPVNEAEDYEVGEAVMGEDIVLDPAKAEIIGDDDIEVAQEGEAVFVEGAKAGTVSEADYAELREPEPEPEDVTLDPAAEPADEINRPSSPVPTESPKVSTEDTVSALKKVKETLPEDNAEQKLIEALTQYDPENDVERTAWMEEFLDQQIDDLVEGNVFDTENASEKIAAYDALLDNIPDKDLSKAFETLSAFSKEGETPHVDYLISRVKESPRYVPPAPETPARNDLFAQIHAGKALKKVEPLKNEPSKTSQETNPLLESLMEKMEQKTNGGSEPKSDGPERDAFEWDDDPDDGPKGRP